MALPEADMTRVSADEVAVMKDAELAQFMQQHRLPDGNYDLPVDGWDELSREDRSLFAERLEAQKRSLAQSPTACSRLLDLDDLDSRLHRVSPNQSFSLRPQSEEFSRSRSPTPPYDPMKDEIETYYELVETGGRPLYPTDLVQDIYREPHNYSELLRPWQESLTQLRAEGIFQRQLQRWQNFRRWQNDHRNCEDKDDSFPAYVERQKLWIEANYIKKQGAKRLAEIEANPSCLKSGWDLERSLRERQRQLCREHDCRGFRDYVDAVKRRLACHGFTQHFHLDEDPTKQDMLTTWIEYLNYEYWWLDKYTSDIKRLEPEHDKLWQELVEKKVLKPHETREFVRTDASGMEREKEKDQARKAYERAESEAKQIYVLTQEDPKRLRIPKKKRISMMKYGTEKLLAARRRLEQARSESFLIVQFVRATFGYAGAKRDAARHRNLVQWVLEQVPLIEAEINPSTTNHSESDEGRTKRKLASDEEPPERRARKRVMFNLRERRSANARHSATATETQPEPSTATDQDTAQNTQPDILTASSLHKEDNVQAMPQGLRRSARIAARRSAFRESSQTCERNELG